MDAILALEDGRVFRGEGFGHTGTSTGEACFNTSMTGYQEVLTDPSYRGQIVTMTYPLIGNYGVNAEDAESREPHVRGFVVGELCRTPSNFRSEQSLSGYFEEHEIIGIEGGDTRALTKVLHLGVAGRSPRLRYPANRHSRVEHRRRFHRKMLLRTESRLREAHHIYLRANRQGPRGSPPLPTNRFAGQSLWRFG